MCAASTSFSRRSLKPPYHLHLQGVLRIRRRNPRRGILFEGKPGTGKTHLAKAMSSEAGVPFSFVLAPAFQLMFYGYDRLQDRSFFKEAEKSGLARKAARSVHRGDRRGRRTNGRRRGHGATRRSFTDDYLADGIERCRHMVNELLIQLQPFDTPAFWGPQKNRFIDLVNMFRSTKRRSERSRALRQQDPDHRCDQPSRLNHPALM